MLQFKKKHNFVYSDYHSGAVPLNAGQNQLKMLEFYEIQFNSKNLIVVSTKKQKKTLFLAFGRKLTSPG